MRIRTPAGSFTGISLHHDRGALVRAVLEGVAYGLRDTLELLRGLGVEPTAGRASGGGAHSRLWLEIVASALGLPLERSVVDEGSAYGAALLAGVAAGTFRRCARGSRSVRSRARDRRAERCLGVSLRGRLRSLSRAVSGDSRSGGTAWGLKTRSRSSRARVAGSGPRSVARSRTRASRWGSPHEAATTSGFRTRSG